jgi:hypothetical protein
MKGMCTHGSKEKPRMAVHVTHVKTRVSIISLTVTTSSSAE